MKKYTVPFILFIFLFIPFVVGGVSAASLKFDATTVTIDPGKVFELQLIVDPGSDNIRSVDAYILFPPNFQVLKVTPGTYFPTVTNNIQSSKVYVAGLVDDPATSKTGAGTVATISFQALLNASGTGKISFDCRDGASDSSKVIKDDINATNVIVCGTNGSTAITVGTGGGGPTITPTVAPSGAGSTSATTPQTLPQTGSLDNILNVSISGVVLLVAGLAVRLLL